MLKYPVTILVNMRPGYSDYNLGQQLKKDLESRGCEVTCVDKKTANIFGQTTGRHLISFYTDMVWPQYKYARHVRPKSCLHIQCIAPKVYPYQEYVAYLATLVKPKMSGIPVAHLNVSPATDRQQREILRKYFSPSIGRAILQNTKTIFYGVEEGFTVHEDADPDLLIVPYNRWDPGSKNLPLHMELSGHYKALSERRGRPYRQLFYYNKDDVDPTKDVPAQALEVYEFADQFYEREAYRASIGKAGMFLSTSVRESFGLYYVELLMSGVVGVIQDYPWIRSLLPEYPFVASRNDLVPMMEWVRNNFAEARSRIIDEIQPIIRQRYSQKVYLDGIFAELQHLEKVESAVAEEPEEVEA